jgi:transcriptional regulator with XRE-family HTH domain
MIDYYEYSIPELVKLLGARFKDYRLRSNMTQKEVSEQSGITITTIHKFENGSSGNLSTSDFSRFWIYRYDCLRLATAS